MVLLLGSEARRFYRLFRLYDLSEMGHTLGQEKSRREAERSLYPSCVARSPGSKRRKSRLCQAKSFYADYPHGRKGAVYLVIAHCFHCPFILVFLFESCVEPRPRLIGSDAIRVSDRPVLRSAAAELLTRSVYCSGQPVRDCGQHDNRTHR